MHCWKSININKEIGNNRIFIFSTLLGILSFIFLYLPFSMLHQSVAINELEFLTVFITITLLPLLHRLISSLFY